MSEDRHSAEWWFKNTKTYESLKDLEGEMYVMTVSEMLATTRDCSLGKCVHCGGPIIERIWPDKRKNKVELACHYCGRGK